jgi:hypothetical protein
MPILSLKCQWLALGTRCKLSDCPIALSNGFGKHISTLSPDSAGMFLKEFLIFEIFGVLAYACNKISM